MGGGQCREHAVCVRGAGEVLAEAADARLRGAAVQQAARDLGRRQVVVGAVEGPGGAAQQLGRGRGGALVGGGAGDSGGVVRGSGQHALGLWGHDVVCGLDGVLHGLLQFRVQQLTELGQLLRVL